MPQRCCIAAGDAGAAGCTAAWGRAGADGPASFFQSPAVACGAGRGCAARGGPWSTPRLFGMFQLFPSAATCGGPPLFSLGRDRKF